MTERPGLQPGTHLEVNPQVAVTTGSTGSEGWNSGKDVVVEGTAVPVTSTEALQALADAWFAKYGDDWRFAVRGQEFVEPGGPDGGATGGAGVYRVDAAKVIAFGAPHGQKTYSF